MPHNPYAAYEHSWSSVTRKMYSCTMEKKSHKKQEWAVNNVAGAERTRVRRGLTNPEALETVPISGTRFSENNFIAGDGLKPRPIPVCSQGTLTHSHLYPATAVGVPPLSVVHQLN